MFQFCGFLEKKKFYPQANVSHDELFLEEISTCENILHKDIQVGNGFCILCGADLENATHIFLCCMEFIKVWKIIDRWVGRSFVQFNGTEDSFNQFTL